MSAAEVAGSVEKGYEPVRAAFAANFERYGEVGAGYLCCAHGQRVIGPRSNRAGGSATIKS